MGVSQPSATAGRKAEIVPAASDMADDGELPAEVVVPETTKRQRSTAPEAASTPLASAMAAHMESVILIEVTAVSPNFIQPWKMHGQRQSSGSGFIISGRRIITNHHVVKDAIDVRLRKHGVARRWRGKVVVSAHDVSARTATALGTPLPIATTTTAAYVTRWTWPS